MATRSSGYGNLKIADLKNVKSALWDARAKWRDIGSCIGVDEGTLDTMKGKDGDCLNGILSHWLRGVHNPKEENSKPRTWHTLIEALQDKIVSEEVMADKLEKEKYPDTNQDRRRAPPDVLPATHNLTFSSSMSDADFFKHLSSKGMSKKDCNILSKSGITPSGFLQFEEKDFDDIGLTKFGEKLLVKIFKEIKGQHCDQQPVERDRSHEGSRGRASQQHSSQAKRRDKCTVNESTSVTHLNDSDHGAIYEKLAPRAAKWRDIGRELGFTEEEMDNIQCNPMLMMQSPPQSWLKEMLSQWLQWAPGDGRGSTGFATRESLHAALLKANLGQLARQFLN